jgi:hypothetical protein
MRFSSQGAKVFWFFFSKKNRFLASFNCPQNVTRAEFGVGINHRRKNGKAS